jgi:polysaccharide pyruvyl transferase WcaK-like protein
MRNLVLFDASVATDNLGDHIIMDAIRRWVDSSLADVFTTTVPTHDYTGPVARQQIARADIKLVGGTNMLASHLWWHSQWKLRAADYLRIHDCILFGVGWHKYQAPPDFLSRLMYRQILSSRLLHSVRDRYTQNQLRLSGIENVIYTGCPTMWGLTTEHCSAVPEGKSDVAVVMLTAYRRDSSGDAAWLQQVAGRYRRVYFWSQMADDLAYMKSFGVDHEVLAPNNQALDHFLENNDCDYIGTRLHGGIRALQYKRRAAIMAVDNRAREIGKDTGLPVFHYESLADLTDWIQNGRQLKIEMPWGDIERWGAQFRAAR